MSWPQWPGSNLGQPSMVQPAVINPAPNVVNPSANQYTPEQWAQMQHQNWQQWAQWQQQFQQWQQQYGAEYQKSMNAIAQAAIPPQASVPFLPAPPLPAENKPPPPPDEPVAPPQPNVPFGMNVLPPSTQSTYNTTAAPPQPPHAKSAFDNKYPQYRNTVPPNQTSFSTQDTNQQRFNRNQNYNREPQGQNWQNQNRNQQGVNRFNQPPPRGSQFENKPEFGAKRAYFSPNDVENTKRNKIEETNKWDENQPQNIHEEAQRVSPQQKPLPQASAKSSNPEELSEAEKKFDKQFNDWEAQFQKWKEQNANHPDKEQYRQYEKKWETWRAQLLERREQMKRKRLGLSVSSPQQPLVNKPDQEAKSASQPSSNASVEPPTFPTGTQISTSQEGTVEKSEIPGDVPIIRPPPNLNNQPLEFKQSGINIKEPANQKQVTNIELINPDSDQNDFLKSSTSDGIPGLDLVKETNNEEETSKNKTNDKPDLEAISRGINSILGDQKLLNMLSLVSQNQNKAQQLPAPKMDSPKFSPVEEYIQEENQYSNDGHDEHFTFEKPSFHDELSGNQSIVGDDCYNEDGSNSYGDSRHFSNSSDNFGHFSGSRNLDKQHGNRNQNFVQDKGHINFNRGPGGSNFANFNRMGDQPNRDVDNVPRGNLIKNRNQGNEFNQFNRSLDNFSQGLDNTNRPPNMYNRSEGFSKGSDNLDNFNRGPRVSGSFNRGSDNFKRDSDFSRGPDVFNRSSGNFRGQDNFNRGPDNYNRGPDNFNRGSDNFNRGPDNFNRGPDNFNRGPDNFNRGPDNFNRGPDNFNKGPDNFNKGSDNFNRGPGNFNRGADIYNRGPDFSRGPDNFSRDSEILNRSGEGYGKGPGNFRGHESFNRANDNFNRDSDIYRDGPNVGKDVDRFRGPDGRSFDYFNRGGDKFNRGPNSLGRGQENFNRGPNNFNRGDCDFNKGPENVEGGFGNAKRMFEHFNKGPSIIEKGQNMGKGPNHPDRDSMDLNCEVEEFSGPPSFVKEFADFDKGVDGNFSRAPHNFNNRESQNRPPSLLNRPIDRNIDHFGDSNRMVPPGNFEKGLNSATRGPMSFNQKPELTEDASFKQNTQFNAKEEEFDANSKVSGSELTLDVKLGPRPEKLGDGNSNNFGNFPEHIGSTKINLNTDLNLNSPGNTLPIDPLSKKNQSQSGCNVEEGMWKTSNVIDYAHKSLADEPEVILEVFYTFDYRHKPLNRIPYPSRPKWLSEMVAKYPEFDLGSSRNTRYEPRKNEKFDSYNTFDSRGKVPFDDWSRRNIPDRDRKFGEDRKRKLCDDRERYNYDEKERQVKEYRSDKGRRGFDRDDVLNEDNGKVNDDMGKSRVFDEQKLTDSKARYSKVEWTEDDDYCESEDRCASDSKQNECGNVGSDKQGKAKSTDKNSTHNSTKLNITSIEDLLNPPGRYNRPPRIVIILRGPPGSGKSFLAKLIKDKEVENGGSAPRILCLDDYFMVEQEKEVEEDGRKNKVKEMVYEYEEDMEASYRQSLMKSFKKTITDGYFTFIIVDNINDKVKYFGEMWSFAKQNGFQVYICQMELDVQNCTKRNIHGRSESEIEKCVAAWETTPSHHPILDATSLIQSGSIPEVEMEEINSPSSDIMNEEQNSMEPINRSEQAGQWKTTSNWMTTGSNQYPQNQDKRGFGGLTWKNERNRRK